MVVAGASSSSSSSILGIASGFFSRALHSSKTSSGPPTAVHGIHVFHCPDVVGIVAKLSECIALRGGNIHSVDVFVPENKQVFYSRCEFVFHPARWPRDEINNDFMKLSKLFNAERSVVRVPYLDPKYKIAVLASKQDHCLFDLLHRWQEGRLPVDISCVISNHVRSPNTHVIRFLERHGIPYHHLPTTPRNKREDEILELVADTDFLVLARYMQVERVSHRDTLQSFVQKSENLEKQCLAQALKSYCELQVLHCDTNKTVVF
ncbi:formyltetrahydrofolate deformylase 2, mitochondrial-like isoform X3 [Phoenix dactylifera]|uniref:Formyltetrahydrofolate deformylase 2, mitochondrial-like isoform X3 n=1 Tax=Phoenix dactylifera TaxID=42345 RepID=A0A8B8J9Z5_PHODC|nr:formyltetrahydrofolate deformylase 2, mitochondrial-like isoform X3 [Phoenix dactylifera]